MSIPRDRFAALRPDDQFIVSYPRSGNTWMRHLVRDVIVLAQPERGTPESIWMLIPDVHIPQHEMQHPAQREFGIPRRILKSHHLEQLGGYRLLYLFREPADTLVSYYHFHRLQEGMRHQVNEGLDQFCLHMLQGWCEHVELALQYRAAAPENVLFIGYEELISNGPAALTRAIQFLGLEATPNIIAQALERNAFAKLREKEEKTRAGADEYFFRKGQVGSAWDELKPATLDQIIRIAVPMYVKAGHAAPGMVTAPPRQT